MSDADIQRMADHLAHPADMAWHHKERWEQRMAELRKLPASALALPEQVAANDNRAQLRFLKFFAANIRNPHTRRAYARAHE